MLEENQNQPTVTVSIITYNHEGYIAKALDSVLSQRGQFIMDIIIGEDGSTDKTAEIVLEYQRRFPEIIKVIINDPKDKIYRNGKPTGIKNFLNNLNSCNGKYIALLDGDDYWISEDKLQKQIYFLENNPEFVGCCHRVECVNERDERTGVHLEHEIIDNDYKDFDMLQIIKKNPIPSLSVVFRNSNFHSLPAWINTLEMMDWPLHIINAKRGKFRYFSETMGAYRVHSGGAWAEHRVNYARLLEAEISVWASLIQDGDFSEYYQHLKGLLNHHYTGLYKIYLREKKFKKSMEYISMFEKLNGGWGAGWAIRARMQIFRKFIKWKFSEIIKRVLSAA